MKKTAYKNTRRSEEIKRELAVIIREEIKDPRISPMTSVIEAEATTDLQLCRVYVSVLGDEAAKEETIAGLKSASGFVRKELARRLDLRNTPTIEFVLDNTIEKGMTMSKKIDEIMKTQS